MGNGGTLGSRDSNYDNYGISHSSRNNYDGYGNSRKSGYFGNTNSNSNMHRDFDSSSYTTRNGKCWCKFVHIKKKKKNVKDECWVRQLLRGTKGYVSNRFFSSCVGELNRKVFSPLDTLMIKDLILASWVYLFLRILSEKRVFEKKVNKGKSWGKVIQHFNKKFWSSF